MKRVNIWEIIAWTGLALLVIQIILKLFKIIETPLIFEMAPIITLCLILGALVADLKNIKSETKRIEDGLIRLGQDFRQLKGEPDVIKRERH